ncbi:MAG: hypothetical protein V3U79_02665 [Dehalococcoidia bacterium]
MMSCTRPRRRHPAGVAPLDSGHGVVTQGPKARYGVAILALLILGLLALACGGSSEEADLTIADAAPRDAEAVGLVDLRVIGEDQELALAADPVRKALNGSLANLGLGSSDLTGAMTFLVENNRVLVAQGPFDLEEISQRLADTGHLVMDVEGTEVWFGPIGNVAFLASNRIALTSDFSSLELMVSQLKEKRALGTSEAISSVLDALPPGFYTVVSGDCAFVAVGCRAIGMSFNKKDSTLSSFDFVAVFDSEAEVSASLQDLEAFVHLQGLFSNVASQMTGGRFMAHGEGNSVEIFDGLAVEFTLQP